MEPHEFQPTIQRLSFIAQMVISTDIEGAVQHLSVAESVAPVFDPEAYREGSRRLNTISTFLGKAMEFKRDCQRYASMLSEAEKIASARRLELQAPASGGSAAHEVP